MQWINGFSKGPQMHCRYTFVTNRPFSQRNNHAGMQTVEKIRRHCVSALANRKVNFID